MTLEKFIAARKEYCWRKHGQDCLKCLGLVQFSRYVHQGGIVELKPYFMRRFLRIKCVSTKAVRLLMQLPLIIIEVELQGPGSQRLYATELKPGVDAQTLETVSAVNKSKQ